MPADDPRDSADDSASTSDPNHEKADTPDELFDRMLEIKRGIRDGVIATW